LNRRADWYASGFAEITAGMRRDLATLGLTLSENSETLQSRAEISL